MIGDLSIRSSAVDPVPSVRAALEGPTRHRTPTTASPEGSGIGAGGDAPGQSEQIERLRAMLTDPDTRVRVHHDEASGRAVIQIESLETGETVDQIPNDELLRLYASIRQPLVDRTA